MKLSRIVSLIPSEIARATVSRLNRILGLRPSSAPFLSGDTFRSVADWIVEEGRDFDPGRVARGDLVFVASARLRDFAERYLPRLAAPIVLLSHQGDLNIDERFRELMEQPSILHWYAQNCLVEHPRVTPLPIGLEDRWRHNNGPVGAYRRLGRGRPARKPKIAFAFALGTNLERRVPCYVSLSRNPNAVELEQPLNGSLYRREVRGYMFVASPPGNGADTHRTWEAMYLGVVPLVEDNAENRYFAAQGLPLHIVGSWDELKALDAAALAELYASVMARADRSLLDAAQWIARFRSWKAKGSQA